MAKSSRTASVSSLPLEVIEADRTYPKMGHSLPSEKRQEIGIGWESGFGNSLVFYRVKDIGWVLTTLHISNPSRRAGAGTTARSYGIGVADEKIYTVGRGPHVLEEVEVYLSIDNLPRLQRYVDLWKKGMADASAIRDRISSRRAQGQLHRANGRTGWTW